MAEPFCDWASRKSPLGGWLIDSISGFRFSTLASIVTKQRQSLFCVESASKLRFCRCRQLCGNRAHNSGGVVSELSGMKMPSGGGNDGGDSHGQPKPISASVERMHLRSELLGRGDWGLLPGVAIALVELALSYPGLFYVALSGHRISRPCWFRPRSCECACGVCCSAEGIGGRFPGTCMEGMLLPPL